MACSWGFRSVFLALVWALFTQVSFAGIEGTLSGVVTGADGKVKSGVTVQLRSMQGKLITETTTSESGAYQMTAQVGDYQVVAKDLDQSSVPQEVHVASSADSKVSLVLEPNSQELVIEVKAKRKMIQASSSVSRSEVSETQIKQMPMGSEVSLPKLIAVTTPGVVPGPFGQMFIRGNHGSIQYQIDGIQMPETPSNTFGQTFSPRNIDHMEVITGGIPAEFGQRLAAVVNIVTKSGPEKPSGELELNYSFPYSTLSPHLLYGGSNDSGSFRYYFGFNYFQTNRGLDTPNPRDLSNSGQLQGGSESVHNRAFGDSEFAKFDWQLTNTDKLSAVLFHSYSKFQIPNYPSSFSETAPYFSNNFTDAFGNETEEDHGVHTHARRPIYFYRPADTDNTQAEQTAYLQTAWRHTFKDRSYFQLAPYFRLSSIVNRNDLDNDFYSLGRIADANPSSFAQDRQTYSLGLKGDYTFRYQDNHLFKTGFQAQAMRTLGSFTVWGTGPANTRVRIDNSHPNTGFMESFYFQDDYTIHRGEGGKINHNLVLNAGLRWDGTQFRFQNSNPNDGMLQPRLGLNYMPSEETKFHVFYGKLFNPPPFENLNIAFQAANPSQTYPADKIDARAEKADFVEAGVARQLGSQVAQLNVFYKNGYNVMDHGQLLRTPLTQVFNFEHGYAYGAEVGLKGQLSSNWSNYVNYSYLVARARGEIVGGVWANDHPSAPDYQPMDHSQTHTLNGGLTYTRGGFWWTTQALFGSGLNTGHHNDKALPSHWTFDTTVGYEFKSEGSFWGKWKVSADVLNLFDNRHPVTIASPFTGSQYAAGRQLFVRLAKSF